MQTIKLYQAQVEDKTPCFNGAPSSDIKNCPILGKTRYLGLILGLRFAIQEKFKRNPNWFSGEAWKNIKSLIQEENYEAALDVWNDENALTDLVSVKTTTTQLLVGLNLEPEDFDL